MTLVLISKGFILDLAPGFSDELIEFNRTIISAPAGLRLAGAGYGTAKAGLRLAEVGYGTAKAGERLFWKPFCVWRRVIAAQSRRL